MTPGFQHGNFFAFVSGGQFNLAHGGVTALGERRQRRNGAAIQSGLGLLKQPGIAEYAPADHGHVCAGPFQNPHSVLSGEDIAIGDNGDGNGALYFTDSVPIGPSAVHLHAGAPVDGDRRDAHGF